MFPCFVLNKSVNDINLFEDPEIFDFLTEDVVRYFRSLILKIIEVIDYAEYRYKDIFPPYIQNVTYILSLILSGFLIECK